MANRERGEMTLAAGDQTYLLRLTTNACCEVEDQSGKVIDDLIRGASRGSVRDLRWLLWASLQDHHRDTVTTPIDAGVVIDAAGGIAGVWKQLLAFIALNTSVDGPQQEGAVAADPPKAQASGGTGSMPVLVRSA